MRTLKAQAMRRAGSPPLPLLIDALLGFGRSPLASRIKATFEEIHKSPRFCGRGAAGRKHGPQIKRWKAPLRQHRAHGPRTQFRGEHPFRRDGQPDMGKDRSSDAFGRSHLQPTLDLDRRLGAVAPKRPDPTFALHVDIRLMLAELLLIRQSAIPLATAYH